MSRIREIPLELCASTVHDSCQEYNRVQWPMIIQIVILTTSRKHLPSEVARGAMLYSADLVPEKISFVNPVVMSWLWP